MDLVKKVRNIKIADKEFIMCFDMRSIAMFKELSGTTFTNAMPNLFAGDDLTIINFLGATLRPSKKPTKVVGKDIYSMDILGLLLTLTNEITALLSESLPKGNGQKKQ